MSRRALVIDDEPDVTTYMSAVLGDRGWEVRTANSADEGLALARDEPPDVILLDLMMPERGGLSTLVALRKDPDLKTLPIVIVTGIDQEVRNIYGPDEHFNATLERAKKFHPDAYLEKPVDPEVLLQVVDELVPEIQTA